MRVTPITLAEANEYVAIHHRHHKPTVGHIFSVAVADGDDVHGVAIVGRPVARALQDGFTAEVNRVATDGHRNACSMLYATCWRAARALGYRKLITYTLASGAGDEPARGRVASRRRDDGTQLGHTHVGPPARGLASDADDRRRPHPVGGSVSERERMFAFFRDYRSELERRIRAHMEDADTSDDEGSHVGFARHHRALAAGLYEALHSLDAAWRDRDVVVSASDCCWIGDPCPEHNPEGSSA